jgi:hypothetical protein
MANPKYADFINAQKGSELESELNKGTENMVSQDPNKNINVYQPGGDYKEFYPKGDLFSSTSYEKPGTHQDQQVGQQDGFRPIQDPFYAITQLPDQQLKLQMAAIENEYVMATHKAKQTTDDVEQIKTMYGNAKMLHDMKIQEAVTKYQRTQLMFRKYQGDNTLSRENAFDAKMKYIQSNPIFEMPDSMLTAQPKPEFSQEYKDIHIGRISDIDLPKDIADDTGLNDRQKAEKAATRWFGKDFDKKVPELQKIIDEQWPQEKEQQKGENIFSQIGKALSQTAQHPIDWLTDPNFQRKAQGIDQTEQQTNQQVQQTPTTLKPKGYPEAVWSKEYGMWTVIRKGKIVGLKGMD